MMTALCTTLPLPPDVRSLWFISDVLRTHDAHTVVNNVSKTRYERNRHPTCDDITLMGPAETPLLRVWVCDDGVCVIVDKKYQERIQRIRSHPFVELLNGRSFWAQ